MIKFLLYSFIACLVLFQPLSADWQCRVDYSLAVVAATANQWNPQSASDGNGGAYIVWQDRRGGPNDKLYVQHVNSQGNPLWQANGVYLCQTQGYQYYPAIIEDGTGGAIIVWQDNRSGADYDIYAQRVGADGLILWGGSGVAVCTSTGHQYNPHLVSDQNGGAIIVWQDHRNNQYDIFAQRITAQGTPAWTANGLIVCTADGDQFDPEITSDGLGGAVFAWTDYRPTDTTNTAPDIYAQRMNANGSLAWSLNGVAVCRASGTQQRAQLAPDGAQGVFISWQDNRSNSLDQVYTQHLDAGGNITWFPNGIQVTNASGIQVNQRMVSDGAGGTVIVWQDNRKGSDYDIYAQRLDPNGTLLWSPSGKAVCTAPGHQYDPQIAIDGSNVLVGWQDHRNGSNFDIYAQRVTMDGSVKWLLDGQLAYKSSFDKVNPTCAGDGSGGLIVAWADYGDTTGFTDIYAQRIGANGKIAGGCFRSFDQSSYNLKAITFYKKNKGNIAVPNVGNLRDSLFKRGAFPTGIDIGVPRPDSARFYAWINFGRTNFVKNALPQTGAPRPFDLNNGKKLVGAMRNPSLSRYNNQIVGELAALKLNIAACDYGMTPDGFSDLVYKDTDPTNPFNHKTLRQITGFVDSVLTMWKANIPNNIDYKKVAVSLNHINTAFAGTIDTVSTSPLSFTAVGALFSTNFLTPDPGYLQTIVPVFHRGLAEAENSKNISSIQNYPNPFNPVTQIRFELTEKSYVSLKVYNILGQEIGILYNHELLNQGFQFAEFDGSRLSSGTYFYNVIAQPVDGGKAPVSIVRKMLLIK